MTTADPLTAANPLSDDAAARLAIAAAESEMLEALLATPTEPASAPPRASRASAPRRTALALIGAVAVVVPVLAVLAVLPIGRHARTQPAPPAPAGHAPPRHPAMRHARTSPRVLFARPGWHVWYADEQDPLDGELDFAHDGARIHNFTPSGGSAQLNWYPATAARGYIADRAGEASIKITMRVLGATAHVIQYKDRSRAHHDYSAIWTLGAWMLEFRAGAPDMSAFKADLAQLRVVDAAAWARAMPTSVVAPAERSAVLRTMLRGIPVPPGFNVRQIPGASLDRDRYQLGSAVTGVVACEWFADWARARKEGDDSAVNRAVAAMATAPHWPILRQMSGQGGWTQVLDGYATAMPSGRYFGRPILGDVDSGLGCSNEWHIKLPGARAPNGAQSLKPR